MHPRRFALIGGILMLALGIVALIPNLSTIPAEGLPLLNVESSYGMFLGLFTWNIVNKVVLIVVGLLGIAASQARATSLPKSIAYSRFVFAFMGILAVLGMFPQTNTLFGYAPMFGHDIWLHGVMSLVGAYFGFAVYTQVQKPTDANLAKNQAMAGYPS